MDEEKKVCKRCGRELPLSEFTPCSLMPDGYLNKCKYCVEMDRSLSGTQYKTERIRKKKPVKPVITKRRGRPPKMAFMPPLRGNFEPPDGKERRDRWIEAHRQKKRK